MAKNEKTSKTVASLAGSLLNYDFNEEAEEFKERITLILDDLFEKDAENYPYLVAGAVNTFCKSVGRKIEQYKKVVGSALTQTQDKKKK
jgi:hypothetical protein